MNALLWIVASIWGLSLLLAVAFGIAARWSPRMRVHLLGGEPPRLAQRELSDAA